MPFIWSTLIVFSTISRYQPYSQPFQFHLQFEVYTQLNTFVTSASYLYQNYHYMNPYKMIPHFQKLLAGRHLHYLQFRVVKIKTAENTYEYLITNLPFSFDLNDIKEIYHKRWGIEVSFRYLKHANGLLHFHCKKPEFLKQEIYANLILYNFGIFLANEAADENRRQKRKTDNKYTYEVDISTALKLARKYFIRKDTGQCIDIIKLMTRYVHTVKTEFR